MTRMMRLLEAVLVLTALAQGASACVSTPTPGPLLDAGEQVIELPVPAHTAEMTLEEALSSRRSVREYGDQPLTAAEIGQLLWAAQGITDERGFRTAPSAGALYPLEIYLATASGVFQYDPQLHRLVVMSRNDARAALYQAAIQQEPVRQAPAVFVLTAIYARTAQKYGAERSPRYVHMEAGHAAQNLLLEATALGLGAVPIGAFDDRLVQDALGLVADCQPLYLIPAGHLTDPDQ